MSKEEEDQSFKVSDKRHFDEEGQPRKDVVDTPPPEQATSRATGSKADAGRPESVPLGVPGRIDFPSYILSYYTQSLVLLGEVPNPYTNKKEEDLEAARHTVDILGMLRDKTKGNLTAEEEQLLESVLYEVRMKYMAKMNQIKLP